jgi:hypothetical protein
MAASRRWSPWSLLAGSLLSWRRFVDGVWVAATAPASTGYCESATTDRSRQPANRLESNQSIDGDFNGNKIS